MSAPEPFRWLPIDEDARRAAFLAAVVVRAGTNRATARWTGRKWIYPNSGHPLGFQPVEYACAR